MNAYASLILAAYLIAVLAAKNEQTLTQYLKGESGFIRWAVALVVVMAISEEMGDAGKLLIYMVFIAMAIVAVQKDPNVFKNLTSIITG